MRNAWPRAKLGDVTVNYDARRVPVREADRKPGPYPYYGASGVVDHVDDYLFDGLYLLIAEDGENLRTRQTPVAFLANGRFWVNNHAHIITGNERADTRYLCYALAAADIGGYLTGSAMPKLSQLAMNAIELPLPSLDDQRGIAGMLGALDDAIEHNRRTSRALERLARAIFRAWFVDFEPVHAKATGATSFLSMPQNIFDSLPTTFTPSELGPIPDEWSVGVLRNVSTEHREQVTPKDVDPRTPYIGLEHMPRRSVTLAEWGQAGKVTSGKLRFRARQILFGKLRPYFHKVGIAPLDGVCSTDIVVFGPTSPEWFSFLLEHASSNDFVSYTNACSTGTKMPRTNWGDMSRYPVVKPPIELAEKFNEIVSPMFDWILEAIFESRKLAELRDYLLPKLLSGYVRVRDRALLDEENT
ncbi:MAG: restriction endonuclease subunit S [Pirellulales bacterium]